MPQNDSTRDQIPGFGEAIRARRHAAGLSLMELGEMAGVNYQSINKLELGRRAPSLRLAAALAAALGVSLDALLLDAARRSRKANE